MNRLFLKPSRPGLIVRDPRSKKPLPDAGAPKPDNSYWRRRMRAGDVIHAPVTLTVTGPTTSGGEVEIIVGNQHITVPVSPDDTADDIASRINEAVPTGIAAPGSPENG